MRAHLASPGLPRYERKLRRVTSMSHVEFVTDTKVTTLIGCPERSFAAFGGMVRQVLYDNMNHAGFLDYARHAGFVIKLCLCRPYRARTKGQVKRFNVSVRSAPSHPPRSGPLGELVEHIPDSAVTESRGQTGAGSD